MIEEKIKLFDVFIPKYTVILKRNNKREQLFKPYKNNILSDRVRRVEDPIKDIQVKPFYVNDELCAVLWYVIDNYYGTILDSQIKGIRIRKGNILFGDKNSLRHNFKEERFNGWLCGELYIVSNRIIPNARRDDFEKNQEYLNLNEQIKKWTKDISKTIRSISYERNLSEEDNKLINSVNTGDFENAKQIEKKPTLGEGQLLDLNDSQEIAKSDLFNSLSILANINNNVTKYKSINLSNKLTREQKRTYEEIFDLLYEKLSKRTANRVVQIIIDNLVE
jgi:molecular chaperone HtpG